MIVLDTNVLSETFKTSPAEAVQTWFARQDPQQLFLTSITQAELFYGLEILPSGKRRNALKQAIESVIFEEFAGHILPFDESAARLYPQIVAHRERQGRPISQFDAVIAAIAAQHKAVLATRDTGGFAECGVDLVNPWNT